MKTIWKRVGGHLVAAVRPICFHLCLHVMTFQNNVVLLALWNRLRETFYTPMSIKLTNNKNEWHWLSRYKTGNNVWLGFVGQRASTRPPGPRACHYTQSVGGFNVMADRCICQHDHALLHKTNNVFMQLTNRWQQHYISRFLRGILCLLFITTMCIHAHTIINVGTIIIQSFEIYLYKQFKAAPTNLPFQHTSCWKCTPASLICI